MLLLTRVLLAFAFVSSLSVAAQQSVTASSVTGRVLDPAEAGVPRVVVRATAALTNQTFTTTTDREGRFLLPYLPVGPYRISGQAEGFATAFRELQLTVGSAFDLTLQLAVAATSSTIQVNALPPNLEMNRSQISETVLETEIAALPFNGRNYLDLALLVPGVSPTNTNSVQTFAETSPVVGQGYSVNSQRNFSNSFVVDGLSANDDAAGLAGNFYGLDVVREFQVVTSGGDAEFGRALGGYINVLTRSGGNDRHGTVYGLLRNSRLNANNPLSQTRLPLTQGQYGGSLSGPLHRGRTFLFANYEGRRLNTDGIITIAPASAAAINAHLDAIAFSGPRLASASAATLFPTTAHTDTIFLRGDHRFSDRDQFNLRYSFYRLHSRNARGAGSLADVSYGTSLQDGNHTVALSNVATLTPHTFNETRAQLTADSLNAPPNTDTSPAVTVSGVATFGRFSSSPTARSNTLYEAVDNLVLQRGARTLKIGIDFLDNQDRITFPQASRGSYTFASLAAFDQGLYNLGGFTQSFGTPFIKQNNPNLGVYAQGEWKLQPSVTVNAGVRYDLQFLQSINTDTDNLAPRIGAAWSPLAAKTTVVRGSFGLFYDRVPLRALANALLSAGNTTDPSHGRLLSYTYSPITPGAPVFPASANAPPAGALLNYTLMNRHLQTPYSLQASFGIEQQIFSKATLGLSYQHMRGVHLLSSYNANINPDGSRPDPTRGNIKPYDSRFDSQYDGLAVSFSERPVSWGSTRISYNWSKAIDNVGEFFFSSPLNNFDFSGDRSRSDDDQRHRVVFDAVLNTPTSRASSIGTRLGHGWQLSGILQFYSRLPFNVTTGASTLQQTTARPCLSSFFGSLACAEGLKGSVLPRNTGVGFNFFTVNARLSRTFRLREHLDLATSVQAFNSLNHRNDAVPNGTFGMGKLDLSPLNPAFGRATAAADPRSLELAARISF